MKSRVRKWTIDIHKCSLCVLGNIWIKVVSHIHNPPLYAYIIYDYDLYIHEKLVNFYENLT